jgi:hypothetical protein
MDLKLEQKKSLLNSPTKIFYDYNNEKIICKSPANEISKKMSSNSQTQLQFLMNQSNSESSIPISIYTSPTSLSKKTFK